MSLRCGAVALAKAAMATAVVVAMVAGTARVAHATPYIDPWNGGMVFVGPTSAHVSAIYWNPAAIGVMRGAHVWVSSHAAVSRIGIDRASIDPATGEPGSGESFPETSAMVIRPGGFLGATYDFGQNKIAAGIALHLPYRDEQPSKPDDQLRYHTRGGYLRSYMASFAVSYRVRGDLLVGGGASLLFTRGLWRFAVDRNLETCAAPPCDVENPEFATDLRLDVDSGLTPAFGFNIGVLYHPNPSLWLALVYHSTPGLGLIALTGTATADTTTTEPASGDAQVNIHLPMSLQFGVRYDLAPGSWQLVGSLRWVDTSVLADIDMRTAGAGLREAGVREWFYRYSGVGDAILGELGIETPSGENFRLGARLTFDSGGVAEREVSAAQVDGPSAGLSAGIEFGLGGGFALTLSAHAGLTLPRHVTDSAYRPSAQTDCVAAGFDLDACGAAREGSAIPTAAGDYTRTTFGALVGIAWDRL